VSQEYIEKAPVLIMVCSNTSRSISRYGSQCKELYSIIEGIFASIFILLIAVNDEIGACFVGAFEDNKLSANLNFQVC
jgi:nitroreductase